MLFTEQIPNFGKEINLANWRIVTKSPNLNFANIIFIPYYSWHCSQGFCFTITSIRCLLFVTQSKSFIMVCAPPSEQPHTASNTFKHLNNTCQCMQWLNISTQEGSCSRPSVSLNLLQHVYNFLCNSAAPFINDSVHFTKLKSHQLQIYSKLPNISIANICCYTVFSIS